MSIREKLSTRRNKNTDWELYRSGRNILLASVTAGIIFGIILRIAALIWR